MRRITVAALLLAALLVWSALPAQALGGMSLTERVKQAAATPTPTPKPVRVGDIITFGHYEQDGNTGNGQEPIEWLVLEVQPGKALLLSRYGLDAQPYNQEYVDITWEKCTLRTWLNSTFLNTAFSGVAQGAILTTVVDNSQGQGYSGWSTSGGNNTQDKVFLLSYAEANRHLGAQHNSVSGAQSNMRSRVAPTAHADAKEHGAWTSNSNKTMEGKAAGAWWLRSPGNAQNCAAGVYDDGSLNAIYVNYGYSCVRPALWMNLDSGLF